MLLSRTYSEHDSESVAKAIANQLKTEGKNARYIHASSTGKFLVLIED
jgi:hypothetical protein